MDSQQKLTDHMRALGKAGGSATTEAKAAAVRLNATNPRPNARGENNWRHKRREQNKQNLMNSLNIAILAYLPPPHYGNPEVFRQNLLKFKTEVPIIFYSDYEYPDCIKIPNPEVVRGAQRNGQENKFAVNNVIFFTGLRIAMKKKLTHFIYLEEDCRVGCDLWDGQMLGEHFTQKTVRPIGGSMVIYNPCNGGREAMAMWMKVCEKNSKRNYPIPTWGWKGASDGSGSCVFVNGALGIYNVEYLLELFGTNGDLTGTVTLAGLSAPWDMSIGQRMWEKHGVKAYDQITHLNCILSSYGNVITTEAERMAWLRSGRYVGVHQVKSRETI